MAWLSLKPNPLLFIKPPLDFNETKPVQPSGDRAACEEKTKQTNKQTKKTKQQQQKQANKNRKSLRLCGHDFLEKEADLKLKLF